jgi:hypothetical protein
MKTRSLAILGLIALWGCTKQDPINHLVQQASSNPYFGSGIYTPIYMPSNAPINEVVKQAIHLGSINVVTQRDVNINSVRYKAILVETGSRRRVVLLRYEPPVQRWWNGVYDQ